MMALTIEAPELERKVREVAAEEGVAAETYLLQLVAAHLPSHDSRPAMLQRPSAPSPFYKTATREEWLEAFRAWIDSHPRRDPLPENAFDRASFYEGQP